MTTTLALMGAVLLWAGGPGPAPRAGRPPDVSSLKTGYVTVGDARLYYEEEGQGPPLVLLHGGFLDTRMWDPQFEVLSRSYRVIRYDARNHGRSKGVPGPFTHYDDLLAVLDHLGLEEATLVGLSLGGRTIIDFAIAHPERAPTIVLASPGAGGYEFKSEALKENGARMGQAFRDGDLSGVVEFFQRSWTDGPSRAPSEVPGGVRAQVRAMAIHTVENWNLECVAKDLDPPAIDRLGEIRATTLSVVGDLDMPGILEIARAVEGNVAGARTVIIPGAAHMVNMEKAEEFNAAVLEFLEKVLAR
jgi:pimeloyl-ACP methyl ester carboxylesterase